MSQGTPEPLEDDEQYDGLEELLAGIPELIRRLGETEETVAALVEELANYPAGGPWLWEGLEPGAQRALWIELDAFVTWLQNRILSHHASKEGWIAPCWYKHPDAVEQLTALMVAHKASYHPKSKGPSHALVDWFQRCLWPTMDTLKQRQTFKQCLQKREHEEPYAPGMNLVANDKDFTAFVDATVPEAPAAAGPKAPGPVPEDPETGLPQWMVDPGTGEIIEPPAGDEPPDPEAEYARHG
ncbi:DUF4913 domain-containing protein [Paeniglutamicibacter sp. ZC-3]|uniref:DUF4913 domain-containing protein n=1 Tax=Paeniglutamicibacter sp. ZC-3 TaxID=2986919 RepID=UPI0021F732D6|nr:DUF4913 domain-containing protein [Paeniglutamicibacter sp. ZC-3]MCV9996451.1 DUF4913 domain-containing protein [Paeniglutamicibacter sp. ZC-3]